MILKTDINDIDFTSDDDLKEVAKNSIGALGNMLDVY